MDELDGAPDKDSSQLTRRSLINASVLGAALSSVFLVASPTAAVATGWVPIEDRPPCEA